MSKGADPLELPGASLAVPATRLHDRCWPNQSSTSLQACWAASAL